MTKRTNDEVGAGETTGEVTPPEVSSPPSPPVMTAFPPALLQDIRLRQERQQQLQNELICVLRGYFHAKDLDLDRDDITLDLQVGTWELGKLEEPDADLP